jgi:restriction system protein
MSNSWMIRAGRKGKFVNNFLLFGVVGIECPQVGIITKDVTKREIFIRYMVQNPLNTKIQARNTITQIDRFVHSIEINDYVLTYEPNQRLYYIGQIKSDVRWDPKIIRELPCVRNAKWTKKISRDNINSKYLGSLGALLTVFMVKPLTIENILINAKDINSIK